MVRPLPSKMFCNSGLFYRCNSLVPKAVFEMSMLFSLIPPAPDHGSKRSFGRTMYFSWSRWLCLLYFFLLFKIIIQHFPIYQNAVDARNYILVKLRVCSTVESQFSEDTCCIAAYADCSVSKALLFSAETLSSSYTSATANNTVLPCD